MSRDIRIVTVLGANGTMGANVAAIFASFGKAKVNMVCRDMEKANAVISKACASVRADSIYNRLVPCDYSNLNECLLESDLIFESLSENLDIKLNMMRRISDVFISSGNTGRDVILSTGTSGLSINILAEALDEGLRDRFIGIHMFNPPYVMSLCELIPSVYTSRELIGQVWDYCSNELYRTNVIVKDSAAFLGNRIGFNFIASALVEAEKYKGQGGIDYIDSILGPFSGRAMAPIVTADFVGLDTTNSIIENLRDNTSDYNNINLDMPSYVGRLIERKCLGRKTANCGLYKTIVDDSGRKNRLVYDIESDSYRPAIKYGFPFASKMIAYIREGNYRQAFDILISNDSHEAGICLRFLLNYVVYSLTITKDICDDIHYADDAMATGFNWCPPLAVVDAFGGKESFLKLCHEHKYEIGKVELIDGIAEMIEPSHYDYRKFFRAR